MMQLLTTYLAGITASNLVLLIFFGVPLLALLLYVVYVFRRSGREKMEWMQAQQLQIEELKAHGQKLRVRLSDCEIVTTEDHYEPEYQAADIILGQTAGPEYDVYHAPMVSYTTYLKYNWNSPSGQQYSFRSNAIAKDKESVLFYTTADRYTDIYFDENNPSRYYFDLTFFEQGL